MATPAVITVNIMKIPGLGVPLDISHLNTSCSMYNSLPHIAEQTEIQTKPQTEEQKVMKENLKGLLGIIDRYTVGDYFRIHSLHRHSVLPKNTIRLETDAGKTGYKWANATPTKDVDLTKVHLTFFKLHNGVYIAFEFAQGPLPVTADAIPTAFLGEMAAFIAQHQLDDKIALELGHFAECRSREDLATAEVEVQYGVGGEPFTLSVSAKDLVGIDGKERRLVPTSWNVSSGPEDADPPPGTYYNEAVKSDGSKTHKVFVGGGNSSGKDVTAEKVVQELVGQGLIRDTCLPQGVVS